MRLRTLALTACAVCVVYHALIGTVSWPKSHWQTYPWSQLRILHLVLYIETLLVPVATYLISGDMPPFKAGGPLRTFRSWRAIWLWVVDGLWVGGLLVSLGWWHSTRQEALSGGIAAFEGGVMAHARILWIDVGAHSHCTTTAQSLPSHCPGTAQ